ncbi:hypothetical protein GLOIN_2v1872974 [Rhizophagus irregularis DAOM 181602=DAOM 197198]|nr:hypothetical protein RirG_070900 [Rhizophagus irregularis DAOM 197198w]GBC22539.2 hypothetical protein GLOIN_2v1872974 [Rhizophagus irregularis DAOM 181602=DAOM 197198]
MHVLDANNTKDSNASVKEFLNSGNPNAPDTLEDKLIMAKMHRFLFLESQYIDKPIKHLKYSKKTSYRMLRIINTWFLFFLLAYRRVNAFNIATPEASTTTPASTSEIIAIVFNPNENMRPDLLHRFTQLSIFVPNRLRPYIPSQPIYSPEDAIYYAPSSTGWFKYLEKKVKSAAKAAINQQERKADLIKQIE